MIKAMSTVMSVALAGGAFLGSGVSSAAPHHPISMKIIGYVSPEIVCKLDEAACLEAKATQLGSLGDKIADVGAAIRKTKDEVARNARETKNMIVANQRLLMEAKELWDRSAGNASVNWKGRTYTMAEFRAQLKVYYDEGPILKATAQKAETTLADFEERERGLAVQRTKILSEQALLGAKMAAAQADRLVANFETVARDIDKLTSSAKAEVERASGLLNTADTLKMEPPAAPSTQNQEFESFIRTPAASANPPLGRDNLTN